MDNIMHTTLYACTHERLEQLRRMQRRLANDMRFTIQDRDDMQKQLYCLIEELEDVPFTLADFGVVKEQ